MQILQQPTARIKHQAVNDRILVLAITLLHRGSLDDVLARLDDIQLDETIIPLRVIGDRVQLTLVQAVHVPNIAKPGVQKAEVGGGQGGLDAAAVVMAADDDVLDVQVAHGVVDDGHDVQVGVGDDVGDVAVDEDLARFQAHDFIGGDAAVAAADVPGHCAQYGGSALVVRALLTGSSGIARRRACRRRPGRSFAWLRPMFCCWRIGSRATVVGTGSWCLFVDKGIGSDGE